MILLNQPQTQTNCTSEMKQFTIESSPIMFEILSSRLYSDPIMAVVRELLTNAWSHTCVVTHWMSIPEPCEIKQALAKVKNNEL